MNLIKMEEAPCFVLENKTPEELMAIQFSENSSRENLHYIDKADGIFNYKVATDASERKICQDLGISKTEVHRSLIVAQLPRELKEAAKMYDIEKYVLLEWAELMDGDSKQIIQSKILQGQIIKRSQLKTQLAKSPGMPKATRSVAGYRTKEVNLSAQDLAKMLHSGKALDGATRDILKQILSNDSSSELQ